MSLWWLQSGWTTARCACGAVIWPDGDPDRGACYDCLNDSLVLMDTTKIGPRDEGESGDG